MYIFLCLCVSLCTSVPVPLRPKVIGSPGTGVIESYEPFDMGAGNQTRYKQAALLTTEPSLYSLLQHKSFTNNNIFMF